MIFDRQSFYKMSSDEMLDTLINVCEELKLFDITPDDLKRLVFEIQLGKNGFNFYQYLTELNKKREQELYKRANDKEALLREQINHDKEIWLRYFQTNKVEAKAFQDFYISSIDETIALCEERGIEPFIDYNKLKVAYFRFKKKYFETHTIKEKFEDE